MASFESILNEIGGFGRYQIILLVILLFGDVGMNWSFGFMAYGGAEPKWMCADENATEMYNATMKNCSCGEKLFVDDFKTMVSEWSLVCGSRWIVSVIATLQMMGTGIGGGIIGSFSDSFGRKKAYFISIALNSAFNVASAFAPNWQSVLVIRFFVGVGSGAAMVMNRILFLEVVNQKWRTASMVSFFELNLVLQIVMADRMRNWRTVSLITGCLSLWVFLVYPFIQESPRWLLLQPKRVPDAVAALKRIARINGTTAPSLKAFESESLAMTECKMATTEKKKGCADLVRSRRYCGYTLATSFMVTSFGFTCFGIMIGVKNMSGDLFANMYIMSLIAFPSRLLSLFICFRFGRKPANLFFYSLVVLITVSLTVMSFFSHERITLATRILSIAVYVLAVGTQQIHPIVLNELIPTAHRSTAAGISMIISRLGAMAGPPMDLLFQISTWVYFAVYAFFNILSFLVALLVIPETKNQQLPDRH